MPVRFDYEGMNGLWSHPEKTRFPISVFPYLNTIWRKNSYLNIPTYIHRRSIEITKNFNLYGAHTNDIVTCFSGFKVVCNRSQSILSLIVVTNHKCRKPV